MPPIRLTSDSADETSPTVIRLQDGEFMMAYDYDWSTDSTVTSRCLTRRSTDDGVTWTPPESVLGGARTKPRLLQTNDGVVWLFYERSVDDNTNHICYCKSLDNGHAWSAEQLLSALGPEDYGIFPLQATNGNIFVFYCVFHSVSGTLHNDLYCQTSSDGGATWSGDLPLQLSASYEKSIAAVEDSTHKLWTFHAGSCETSTDFGTTWSGPVSIPRMAGQPEIRALVEPDGRIVIAFTRNHDIFYLFSTDSGSTWSDTSRITSYSGDDRVSELVWIGGQTSIFFHSDRWANNDIYYGSLAAVADTNPPPWLSAIDAGPQPLFGRTFAPLAYCADETGVALVEFVYALDGQSQPDLQLYDDGAHGDRAAGDSWYGNLLGPFNSSRQVRVSGQFKMTDVDGNSVYAPSRPRVFNVVGLLDTGNLGLYIDPATGGDGPNYSWYERGLPSCEWPLGSGHDYLHAGGLWAGAIATGETLVSGVSFVTDSIDWTQCRDDTMIWTSNASDLESRIRFDDRKPHFGRPLGLNVTKRCLSWSRAPYSDFIIQEHTIRNTGQNGTLTGLYLGFAYDFDVISGSTDRSGFDSSRSLSYMSDPSHTTGYIGVRMLSRQPTAHCWWRLGTDPSGVGQKYQYLASDSFMHNNNTPSDQRVMQSAGPFAVAPGDSVSITVGLVAGDSLSGLQRNADTMKALYDRGYRIGVDEPDSKAQRSVFMLERPRPNPAKGNVSVSYQLADCRFASVGVYRVDGALVRMVVKGVGPSGRHVATWDCRDALGRHVPPGIYFLRLRAGGLVAEQKVIVID